MSSRSGSWPNTWSTRRSCGCEHRYRVLGGRGPSKPFHTSNQQKDHIFHPALNRANYKRYAKSPSVTDFKEFPVRTHYTVIAGKGWEEVADYALDWAAKMQTVGVTSTAEQVVTPA